MSYTISANLVIQEHIHIHPHHNITHLLLDKMANISETIFSDVFSWMKSFVLLIKISLKFVPKGPIDNNLALV